MSHKLGDFAEVQMGFSFRARLEKKSGGFISVIQMKDLLENNTVDCSDLVQVDLDAVKDHHIVAKGDLIFRSRGLLSNTAILNDDPGTAVVAAPLIRIRIDDAGFILPEYLNWFTSQNDAQTFFSRHAKGSTQRMISKEALEDLPVVPEITKQKAIVELAVLSDQEQQLLAKLAKKRNMFISRQLMKIAAGVTNEKK